jgi:two-component system, OmpR family, sensor histidine kinase SenX3
VNVLLIVAIVGWLCAIVAAVRLIVRNRELTAARAALGAPADVPFDAAVEQAKQDADDRIDEATANRHWLVGALDQVVDGVVVVDRIGREVFRNAAAQHFKGARHGDVIAEDALAELLQQALDGRVAGREIQLYGPPRQVLQLQTCPLYSDAKMLGAVAFTRDVTEARRVESVRRDFVANVSHELKTPIGALGLLAETMSATDDAEVIRQLAERVLRESDRLAKIVDDLLDLSHIEAQEAPTREPLPIAVLVCEAVDHVQSAADTAGVPIKVAPRPPDAEISCDHRQLRSALVNLVDNAIKYSEPGEPVEVGARLDGDRVAIVVRDHGIGIPSRDLERIFERFYRVDRARSRQTGGTGLGLAIVRHVAHVHGGEVTVQSREGEGSTFTLLLPLASSGGRALSEAS